MEYSLDSPVLTMHYSKLHSAFSKPGLSFRSELAIQDTKIAVATGSSP